MALSNAERQKRWLAKNRALHNFRRRKKNLSGGVVAAREVRDTGDGGVGIQMQSAGSIPDRSKIQELRELIKQEENRVVDKEPTMPVVKPKVFFNDHGAQISERVWNDLQEKKRVANEVGYEFDPQWT